MAHSFIDGNPKRLTHGYDWSGQICGVDEAVKDLKMLYFCGHPERVRNEGDGKTYPKYLMGWSTACVAACPTDNNVDIKCLMPAFHNFSLRKGGKLLLPGSTDPNAGPDNVQTLDMTVTQSLVKQKSYPTNEFGGRFCLPSEKNPQLKETVVQGSFGHHIRPWLFFGSMLDAWSLLAMSAALASLLNAVFFYGFKKCAGCMIFAMMVWGFLLILSVGAMFLWAIFIDMENPTKTYKNLNPILGIYSGSEAKAYSVVTGMVLIMCAALTAIFSVTSVKHIDEMVGLIAAANECLESSFVFSWCYPLFQSAVWCCFVTFVMVSLPYVASIAYLQKASIQVAEQQIEGLQKMWLKTDFNQWELLIYCVVCAWVFEMLVQLGNYCVAYVVSEWYFVDVIETEAKNKALGGMFAKDTQVKVRVGGVDQNYGPREGVVTYDGRGNKMLVVPVGKKAPGIGRNNYEEYVYKKNGGSSWSFFQWMLAGTVTAIRYHLGSLAIGAPIIALFRIPCAIVKFINGLLTRTDDSDKMNPFQSSHPGTQNVRSSFALLSACLDQAIGKYSKHALNELVLSGGHVGGGHGHGHGGGGSAFLAACQGSYSFLIESGGTVAYLHGAMLMYELMACLAITATVGWSALVVQDKVDWYNDPTDPSYIEDKTMSTIMCCIIAFMVSFCWMSMWNQTADTLLYTVAWNRRQIHLGEQFDLNHHELIKPPGKCCPQQLRYLLPAYEMEAHYEEGVHAHGVGQMGSIIAAMEHGAMGTKGAPNYQTGMGSVFQTGAKMGGF